MCGFVGAVGLESPPDDVEVARLLGAIAHRGPDAEASAWSNGVWLGFRRLSIQDLSSRADQPMTSPDGHLTMVFNGEVYNFVELRAELAAHGHTFTTTGDSEVLLAGFRHWGPEVFPRLNGMFAVAIADRRDGSVTLARDRFGEKPLFIGRGPGRTTWFGSEPEPLSRFGVGDRRLDLARTLDFLALGITEDPSGSFFAGISQLTPGTVVRVDDRGPHRPRRWWSLSDVISTSSDAPPLSDEEVRARLDESVRLRLRSDVTVGSSLSGGVDSAAVVASLRTVAPDREINTFTASFPDEPDDEWDRSERIATHLDAKAHRVEPTLRGLLDELDHLVARQGGPIESPTVYAQWCVMRAAAGASVTVMLDGQGADETWGGYPKYVWFAALDLARRRRLPAVGHLAATWRSLGGLQRPPIGQLAAILAPAWARQRALRLRRRSVDSDLGPALRGITLSDPYRTTVGASVLDRLAESEIDAVILPRLLRYADRNSMAWGREIRLPFLDPAMVEAGLRSDWSGGLAAGWTKRQLRRAVEPRLPHHHPWQRAKFAYQTPARWTADPRVEALLATSAGHLASIGVLPSPTARLPPWRVITLSRFIDATGLTT